MDDPRFTFPKQTPVIKTKARYGSAQEHFQVQSGDVWQAVNARGPHRYACEDVFNLFDAGTLKTLIGGKADMIYTDPPWNTGIFRKFYYYADQKTTLMFEDFLDKLAQVFATTCDGLICCCFSEQDVLLRRAMKRAGAKELGILRAKYGSKYRKKDEHIDYIVWLGTFGEAVMPAVQQQFSEEYEEMHAIFKETIRPGMKVFDPLCGTLNFLIPAAELGALTYGVELIPRKLARGLQEAIRVVGNVERVTLT